MIISILIFLIIFSVIVIGHEFGHYAVARRCGIRVKEFDIGMGPVIFRREGKETDFCIRAFPIGGACLFDGMEALYDPDNTSFRRSSGRMRIRIPTRMQVSAQESRQCWRGPSPIL